MGKLLMGEFISLSVPPFFIFTLLPSSGVLIPVFFLQDRFSGR